jgi:hypothetical protein
VWIIVAGLLWGTVAQAQTALPAVNAGFDLTGFIQVATLNAAPRPGGSAGQEGGTITINGRLIIIPDNLIVQMPASSFTWAQLFDPAVSAAVPAGFYNPARPVQPAGRTGLALNDPGQNHFPSYEVRVVGNIITNPATGVQRYIAAMILPAAQQGLNAQSGYINYIDYATGRFRVGGTMGDAASGTLCEINDPVGRFGLAHSPDPRFTCDYNNPTITTATGYPCGIPNVDSAVGSDPDRPLINRPPNPAAGQPGNDPFLAEGAPLKRFTMNVAGPGLNCDPTKQIPLMVGDWVDFSGTLFKIDPALGPGRVNTFVSVHTLTAHLGIKTAPGTNPAYVRVEEFLFGVGEAGNTGPTVAGIAQETSTRVVLVAFCTDDQGNAPGTKNPYPARIEGIYNPPGGGTEQFIAFPNGNGATNPELQMDDPVRGRIRLQLNKNENPPFNGVFVSNAAGPGNFYREYIVKLNGTRQVQLPDQAQLQPDGTPLPGLIAGQYRLPIFDYIFGEGTNFGEPWPPFNFHQFGFLKNGEGANVGPLAPFPTFQ